MEDAPSTTTKIFYCYSHSDINLKNELEKHIKRLPDSHGWHGGMVELGQDQKQTIDIHLNQADIILLLISPDFLGSDDCYATMEVSIERHRQGMASVIPILLRPVLLEGTPLTRFSALPTNGEPVTLWKNQDAAFFNIAASLLKQINGQKQPKGKSTVGDGKLSFVQKSKLVDLLLACSSMRNSGSREAILRQLPEEVSNGIERHATAQAEIMNIVDRCLAYEGALKELFAIVSFFERNSLAMKQLNIFIKESQNHRE